MAHPIPILLALLTFGTTILTAQEIALTESGKRVVLNPDGTWTLAPSNGQVQTDEVEVAESLLRTFLNAKSNEDRLKLVLDPEKSKTWLRRDLPTSDSIWYRKVSTISSSPDIIAFNLDDSKSGWREEIYIVKTKLGYKVDWLATVGQNEGLENFIQQRSTKPILIRCLANLGSYAGGSFKTQSGKYLAIHLQSILTGYTLRSSLDGKKLYDLLKDGTEHRLVLKIRFRTIDEQRIAFPQNPYADETHVLITEIVALDTWASN